MSLHILSSVACELSDAFELVKTVVLRTKRGSVYTIEIGESLFNATHSHGAKVTRVGAPNTHIGVCHGASVSDVAGLAQNLVAQAIASEEVAAAPLKPHFQHSGVKMDT